MTWPVTMADRPDLMRKFWAHEGEQYAVFDPALSTTPVFAPCCGRKTPADTVVSLHGLTTEIRGGNYLPKKDLDWACDGCLYLLIVDPTNDWTRSKLWKALGAPPAAVRHEKAKELEREQERAHHKAQRSLPPEQRQGFNPQIAYEQAHASIIDV